MAAKLLHSLTDDNLDFQKQIGCMNGLFQLFDRQHVLTGGRRVVAPTHKGIHHGISESNGGGTLENEEHLRSASLTEKIPVKNVQEKQRISTEPSRASFSSLSRSSSSSSLDCIRATHQLGPASFDRITFPETPSRDPAMSYQNSSPQFSRQNRDIRDLVKDSMYREISGLSVKPKSAEDSPRLQHSESFDSYHASDFDLKESLRVLAKFQEAPTKHPNERRQFGRSLSYNSRYESPSPSPSPAPRDAPRFSCDGREVDRTPFDARDVSKSSLKLRDLPRLSLDGSKAVSTRNLKPKQQEGFEFDNKAQNLQQSPARPPSVVAKLMGLESLPRSVLSFETTNSSVTKSYPDRELADNNSRKFSERERSSVRPTSSSKSSWKEPTSPRWRNPVEPAPWKHIEGRRSSQKPGSRAMRGAEKVESVFPSVYSEVEKRLKDLEFTQSGKDLRALKQILEAMQSKKLVQTHKEVVGSDFEEKQLRSKHDQARSIVERRKPPTEEVLASTKRGIVAARHTESPIVIMKPGKQQDNEFLHIRKGLSSGRTAKDLSSNPKSNSKNERTLKSTQTTATRSQQLPKDGYGGLGRSSGSTSPRLLQKKLELEKRARPPTPPDSSKIRRQPNKQQGDSNSPGGRRRPRHSNMQESGERLSETNCESGNSNEKSPRTSSYMLSSSIEKIPIIASSEEKSSPLEFGIVPVEHSSPVSVLDSIVYREDSHSPVICKVEEVQGSCTEYGFKSEIDQNKLQNIENLVQKLRRLNSSHDEAATDYIASLCENTYPDHRYVSEILLASGLLLRDLTSFQLHASSHPINPELFLVLEQTKSGTALVKQESTPEKGKHRRKLVFDTVNEILARKLVSRGPSSLKLSRTAMNAQKLLREVCSEIEVIECRKAKGSSSSSEEDERWKGVVFKDVMHHESQLWTDFDDEISGAVLDVERSIFKDLVNEIVIGESGAASAMKTKPTSRGRPFA